MTQPVRDTNSLPREKPGDVRHVPSRGPDEAGPPPLSPDERGFPNTGDKHRPQVDREGDGSTQTPQEQNRPDRERP